MRDIFKGNVDSPRDKQEREVREILMKLFRGHQVTKNVAISIPLEKW